MNLKKKRKQRISWIITNLTHLKEIRRIINKFKTTRKGFPNYDPCSISIPICIVFVSILINSSYAQSSDNFKTYTNKEMKFSIQHPSNCEADYENDKEANVSIVYFSVPDGKECFQVSMEKVEPYLDTDTMTVKNTSLQQRVQKELDDYYRSSDEEKIIRQNWVTVGGNPGYKIEHIWSCQHCRIDNPLYGRPDHYSFVIFYYC
jgi:hypothetical protein